MSARKRMHGSEPLRRGPFEHPPYPAHSEHRRASLEAIATAEAWLTTEHPDPGTVAAGQAWATIALVHAVLSRSPETGGPE